MGKRPLPWMKTPGVSGFVHRVSQYLEEGVSVIVLLPRTCPVGEFKTELGEHLVLKGITRWDISLPDVAAKASPVAALCNAIGIKWRDPTASMVFENLPGNAVLPEVLPEVVCLNGFEAMNESGAGNWTYAVSGWAEASKAMRDKRERFPPLCLVTPGLDGWRRLPKTDLFLRVLYWWGFPSVLDMRLLCRQQNVTMMGGDVNTWRESILPWLCAGDPFLISEFWESGTLAESQVDRVLAHTGEDRGWSREELIALGCQDLCRCVSFGAAPSEPPEKYFPLWAMGAVNFCPETGFAVSSVALKLLGNLEEIRHRIWRGQSELVLPLLDRLRLRLCWELTSKYGNAWPTRYCDPEDSQESRAIQESPFNCQYGHLETVLKSSPISLDSNRKHARSVQLARWVRNTLAHNRCISLGLYRDFLRELESMDQGGG